ncbi:MAG: DUF2959 domain-containing protein [Candidatus Kuenenia stuttgartiensis]|nr:DUF2959 domain-containing protein [Candidatus Kuenenia stuttgartiensis]
MNRLNVGCIYSLTFLFFVLLNFSGCQTTYYKTMERVGYHKRDIFTNRVKDTRNILEETKEQFKSALVESRSFADAEGSTYEQKYNTLNKEYERCRDKSLLLSSHIKSIEKVAEAFFNEWEMELEHYVSNSLRQDSQEKLAQKRGQYEHLINSMKYLERKMDPVLINFRDQVLYLKHNLNTQSIVSLQDELALFEDEVLSLIKEIEISIGIADSFINSIVK